MHMLNSSRHIKSLSSKTRRYGKTCKKLMKNIPGREPVLRLVHIYMLLLVCLCRFSMPIHYLYIVQVEFGAVACGTLRVHIAAICPLAFPFFVIYLEKNANTSGYYFTYTTSLVWGIFPKVFLWYHHLILCLVRFFGYLCIFVLVFKSCKLLTEVVAALGGFYPRV